jgi:hypothetical protein
MIPAAQTLEIVLQRPDPPRASVLRMMLGPLTRLPARFEVLVVDRTTRRIVIRAPVDGSEHEARALGDLMRADLETHDEHGFLKRHGRAHRHR